MLRQAALTGIALVLVAGCDSGGGSPPGHAVQPARVRGVALDRIGTFRTPVYVAAPPRDPSRLFVVEQAGRIRVIHDGRRVGRPFLDIRRDVSSGGERGLLSMAFAPDYARSRRFYVYFTDRTGDIRIQQFRRSARNANVADPGSRRDVLRVPHRQHPNHNGGQLQFGPDGMLYAGIGDGGGEGDPFGAGQRLDVLLGKLIRIDPRPGGGYRSPRSNPFRRRRHARPEIWAYGLRNPFRFSFDRRTGALAIGDVGQDRFEEVDYAPHGGRGANYGWSAFEGFARYRSGPAPHARRPALAPTHRAGFCALIGGYVVRDRRLRSLYGRYVYGDDCNPRVYSTRLTPRGARSNHPTGLRVRALSSFGEDARGRLYATSLAGGVYRFVPK